MTSTFFFFLVVATILSVANAQYDSTVGGIIQVFYKGQVKPEGFNVKTCIPYVNKQQLTATDAVAKGDSGCFFYPDATCKGTRYDKPFLVKQKRMPITVPPQLTTTPAAFMCYTYEPGPE